MNEYLETLAARNPKAEAYPRLRGSHARGAPHTQGAQVPQGPGLSASVPPNMSDTPKLIARSFTVAN